jgi:putative hydrolase of the HAD superfamily
MDNTLYSESSYYKACYKEIARMISRDEEETVFESMLNIRREEGDKKVFQKIIEIYNLDKEYLNKFVNIYRTHDAKILLYPDVEIFIKSKNQDMKYGILTNGGEFTQKNKIKCLGIEKEFDFIYITGEFLRSKEWKPNKRAFELIKNTGLKFSECIYVGDSFEKDIVGALNVGMNAVLINRDAVYEKCNYNNTPYWIINSFEQINNVLNEIEGLTYGKNSRNTYSKIK